MSFAAIITLLKQSGQDYATEFKKWSEIAAKLGIKLTPN